MARTVFVIGAGASTEFGGDMPIGSELAASIERVMAREAHPHMEAGPIAQAIMYGRGYDNLDAAAIRRVREGIVTKESIDDFIEEWKDVPNLPEIAKLGIAHVLLGAEGQTEWGRAACNDFSHSDALRTTRNSWLGRILRLHNGGLARRAFVETMSDIAFVVFNYDRLIEYHLYHHLTVGLAIPPDEARIIIRSLPIIHVYGSIGELPELGGRQSFGKSEPHTLMHSAGMIRTYTETVESLTGERIASIVSNAEKVVFLGAAYHEQNLQILFPNSSNLHAKSGPAIFGTTYEMRPRRIRGLLERLENPYRAPTLDSMAAATFIDTHQDELFD